MKTREKVGFIDTNNKLAKASEIKTDSQNSQFANIPQGNRYLDAIFLAMEEFVKAEINGGFNTNTVLSKKIEAARTLFEKDRHNLRMFRHISF